MGCWRRRRPQPACTPSAATTLSTAFAAFNEALRLNGGDADAREGLEQVRSRAQQVFFEGYQVRDRDPATALKKFRLVKQIAPPGSELAEKAHSYLVERTLTDRSRPDVAIPT